MFVQISIYHVRCNTTCIYVVRINICLVAPLNNNWIRVRRGIIIHIHTLKYKHSMVHILAEAQTTRQLDDEHALLQLLHFDTCYWRWLWREVHSLLLNRLIGLLTFASSRNKVVRVLPTSTAICIANLYLRTTQLSRRSQNNKNVLFLIYLCQYSLDYQILFNLLRNCYNA